MGPSFASRLVAVITVSRSINGPVYHPLKLKLMVVYLELSVKEVLDKCCG
jgi:hypothetical protein